MKANNIIIIITFLFVLAGCDLLESNSKISGLDSKIEFKVVESYDNNVTIEEPKIYLEMKTEKIKVFGNCGMCESRIEKAASGIDGVSKADWNKETMMLEITFDENKVKIDDVHKAVAKAGHDTEKVKANDDVYNALPGCCKYERE